jgi:hypothetical protein
MVHKELTEEYRGRRYRDRDTVLTVNHVLQVDGSGGPRFRVVYDRDPPDANSTGRGACWLDALEQLPEIRV